MTLTDSFNLAFKTVRGNRLRTGITVAIIAFGIMALIGIITAIQAMNQSLRESFSSMGANAFVIKYKESRIRFGRDQSVKKSARGVKNKVSNLDKNIRREDAVYFKQNYAYPSIVSVYMRGPGNMECNYGDKKTNPVVTVWGGDENYLTVNGFTVADGRNLNSLDVESGRNVCLLGSNVAAKLFGDHPETAVDHIIKVGGIPYRVIGVLKSKGSSGLLRQDDIVVTSYNSARRLANASPSYFIGVMVDNVAMLDPAIGAATAQFRGIRKLLPTDADNFTIEKSDKFAELFITFLSSITGAAAAIGIITLIGAAIGLMNIMLVSVNERTREVGLIKAIGGKRKNVRQQFLFESIIISLLGAIFGIILGVLVGNIFSMVLKTGFVVPWLWVSIGILICSLVGFAAGLYPAIKAAKLNPIVALRYE
ncbi:ABC transporter permease [Hydrotalea sp.]|uniref:ABC transporter permease n=1 Tax=Hydrotalea sp. TaxID=2881279 RepID=UPI0026021405|nr:ABC transporter permease [Hydrotalea sp.]